MIEAEPDRAPDIEAEGGTFDGRGWPALEVYNDLKKGRRAHTSRLARGFTGQSPHPAILLCVARACRKVRAYTSDKGIRFPPLRVLRAFVVNFRAKRINHNDTKNTEEGN
jgi:hypothetical protein